jgi:NAD(P)-dependent dehydrogenase (short-subunit alcohol dehydrogenase family)
MSVVIVTGGTFGIGQAITVLLAQRGHQVVAFGLTAPQVSSTAQGVSSLQAELSSLDLQADILEADVANPADIERVVRHVVEKYGRVDALVNNAAIGPLGTVLTTDEATWDRIIDVNLKGTYLCSRAVLPHMVRQGGGSIVNVGSGAGWGKPNMAAYSASKGGMGALTMAMAYDHFHEHVRVNMVIPGGGGIVTGMSVGRFGGDVNKFVSRPSPGTAAGRPAMSADIAKSVAFLLSEDASVISGTVIDVGCFAHQGGPVPSKN